jgi:hypothetical protein
MAVMLLMKWDDVSPEQYDRVIEELDIDNDPAHGGLLHLAGNDDGGLRVTDIWESQEQFERFAQERMMPAVQKVGIDGQPEVTFLELRNVHSPRGDEVLAMDRAAAAR